MTGVFFFRWHKMESCNTKKRCNNGTYLVFKIEAN